jgi:hypothetical protein
MSLGAEKWIDFNECKDIVAEVKAATGGLGAHAAVVTTAQSSGYEQAIDYLRAGGTLCAVGLPGQAKLNASIFFTVFKALNIVGSYVGCVRAFAAGDEFTYVLPVTARTPLRRWTSPRVVTSSVIMFASRSAPLRRCTRAWRRVRLPAVSSSGCRRPPVHVDLKKRNIDIVILL